MEVGTDSDMLSFAPEIKTSSSQGYTGRWKVKKNVNSVLSLELGSFLGEGRRTRRLH